MSQGPTWRLKNKVDCVVSPFLEVNYLAQNNNRWWIPK